MKHNFRKMKIWIDALELSIETYKITKQFPDSERFGLTSQIRRAAVSVPSNIAEGSGRSTVKDFQHFLDVSLWSSYELETQFIIAQRLDYFQHANTNEFQTKLNELQKMIVSFSSQLN